MFLWKIFSVVILVNVASGNKLLLVNEDDSYEKVASMVKNVVDLLKKDKSEMSEVMLFRYGKYMGTKKRVYNMFGGILNEVYQGNVITLPKIGETEIFQKIRQPNVIIIVSDVYDTRLLLKLFDTNKQSIYWPSKAKFIFVSTCTSRKMLVKISSFFYSNGILDVIIISNKGDNFKIYSYNPFETVALKKFYKIEDYSSVENFYPDKLKNMNGFEYKVMIRNEYPMAFPKETKGKKINYMGIGIDFLKTVTKHQNAKESLQILEDSNLEKAGKKLVDNFNKMKTDFTLNTGLKINTKQDKVIKYVNTFETDGFCALLPYPERKSFFSFFLKPFDLWTWIFIMISVAAFVAVWHFLNKTTRHPNPNSAGYFLFAMFAFFIGQGAGFRNHRLLQKILIQLMIMMTFILGNAYQSVLISMMVESRYGNQITTIQGMIDSNFTFQADPMFMEMFKSSEQYQELGKKITGSTAAGLGKLDFKNLSSNKTGLILTCSAVDLLYHNTEKIFKNLNAIDYFYRVPEKFYTYYQRFPTRPYSMYAEKLQDYSLRIHESGIKQHWKTLMNFEDMAKVKERESNAKEEYFMNLMDMAGAFYCLSIGYAIALLVFLLELMFSRVIKKRIMRWVRRLVMPNRVEPFEVHEVRPWIP